MGHKYRSSMVVGMDVGIKLLYPTDFL